MAAYELLLDEDTRTIRAELAREQYFYHCTLDTVLDSIRKRGLDPQCEHERSSYGYVRREPSKAIRYCTEKSLFDLGLRTTETRAQVF